MFKKLRIKFIAAAMTAVILVLAAIMTAINAVNYYKIRDYADGVLNILVENGGEFSEPSGQENDVGQGDIPPRKPDGKRDGEFYAETPYETRYFSVKYENGEKTANTERIFSVNEEEAVKIADEILKKGKKKGYYGVYRYAVSEKGDLVVLVDCFRQLETSNNFLYASIFISLGGIALVFLLVVVFSKKILRPVSESYEKQKRFITDASHELKTPLTIISANNEITEIETGETDSTRAIAKQVAKMTAMVKNMTSLSKLDEMNGEMIRTEFSLSDALSDVEDLFGKTVKAGGKRTYFSHDEEIVVSGDESLIRQLLSVLFDNAVKYSEEFIKSELKKTGNKAVFTLTNDAKSVKAGDKSEYFGRFYRSDEARGSKKEGSGIGLSIAKEIADLHKATIRAYSEKDGEFTVKAVFPIK